MVVNITYTPHDCNALVKQTVNKTFVNVSCTGTPGLSAYQLAISTGFVGTLEEWLDSLKQKNYIGWHKFENNISWCGIAVEGSLETDSVWKVTRIEVASNGTTTSCVYEDVKVSDYLLLPVCGSDVNAYEFKQSVLADNGLFEADTCLANTINTFS